MADWNADGVTDAITTTTRIYAHGAALKGAHGDWPLSGIVWP